MKDLTRKEALTSLIVLPALAGLMVVSGGIADAKASKTALKYQDHPNGKQACVDCTLFTAGKKATAAGTCSVVAGAISPHGWCTAFNKKD